MGEETVSENDSKHILPHGWLRWATKRKNGKIDFYIKTNLGEIIRSQKQLNIITRKMSLPEISLICMEEHLVEPTTTKGSRKPLTLSADAAESDTMNNKLEKENINPIIKPKGRGRPRKSLTQQADAAQSDTVNKMESENTN